MSNRRMSLVVLISLLALLWIGPARSPLDAQGQNRVGLIVVHGDDTLVTRCISFSEAELTGYEILQRSGLGIVSSDSAGQGLAVCALDGEGCAAEDCFCQCKGSTCIFWSYWQLEAGTWLYSAAGASLHTAGDGDVEGWRWGDGQPPPAMTFDQICAPPATNTAMPTSTPTSTPPPPTEVPITPTPTIWFRLDTNPIPAGSCTTMRWDTANALEVYLDGERVPPSGSREICPVAPQEYQLRVVSASAEQIHTLVLGVTGQSPPTATVPPSGGPVAAPPTLTAVLTSASQPSDAVPTPVFTATAPAVASADVALSPSPTLAPSPTVGPQQVVVISAPPLTATPTSPASPTPPATVPVPVPGTGGTEPESAVSDYLVFVGMVAGLLGLGLLITRRNR